MASGLLDMIAPVLFAMTPYVTYVSLVSVWFLLRNTLTSETFGVKSQQTTAVDTRETVSGLNSLGNIDWQGGA